MGKAARRGPAEKTKPAMKFSVIIATRDRPALFRKALRSVRDQSASDIEIIVVNDGSGAEHRPAYDEMEKEFSDGVRFHHLVRRPNGHGQSYSLNFGVAQARGDYVCFLDDDDYWTDRDYLRRAEEAITAAAGPVDLHFANQAAFRGETREAGPVWVEGLTAVYDREARAPDAAGAYEARLEDLFKINGFCHLNVFILRREFFNALGGLDENIRYECDRDIYLRAVDRARTILYSPHFVSRHNIPDPKDKSAMSTIVSNLEKRLFQLRVLDKAILFADHEIVRRHARRHKVYALKKIAEELIQTGRRREASYYAREALMIGFNLRWAGFTAFASGRSVFAD